jgi:alpha-N-arabinofuranosidase
MTGLLKAPRDNRRTPYHKAHSTELAGRHDCPVGDVRWVNNLFSGSVNLDVYNGATLPVAAAGNVFTKAATASKFDTNALTRVDHDLAPRLERKDDGWYLTLAAEADWAKEPKRSSVTTELLGKAVIPDMPFENADGSALRIDTDYLGAKRHVDNPFPGPFESLQDGIQSLKVWSLEGP